MDQEILAEVLLVSDPNAILLALALLLTKTNRSRSVMRIFQNKQERARRTSGDLLVEV